MDDEWYLQFIGICNQKIESTTPYISSARNYASKAATSADAAAKSAIQAEKLRASLDLGLEIHSGKLNVVWNV